MAEIDQRDGGGNCFMDRSPNVRLGLLQFFIWLTLNLQEKGANSWRLSAKYKTIVLKSAPALDVK